MVKIKVASILYMLESMEITVLGKVFWNGIKENPNNPFEIKCSVTSAVERNEMIGLGSWRVNALKIFSKIV